MKKLLVMAILFLAGLANSNAQVLKFGLKAGVNFANLSGSDADGFDGLTSFHFGAIGETLPFSQRYCIRLKAPSRMRLTTSNMIILPCLFWQNFT